MRGDLRMHLAHPADALTGDGDRRRAAGMQERVAGALQRERRTQTVEQRLDHALDGEVVSLRWLGLAPAGRPDRTAQQPAHMVGLARQRLALHRQEHCSGLEDSQLGGSLGAVAPGHLEQRAEQGPAHARLLSRHRVVEHDLRLLGRQAEPAAQVWTVEAPAHDLVHALGGEDVRSLPPELLALGEPAYGSVAGGQRGRQLFQASEPGHLLDHVSLQRDVAPAKRRRLDLQSILCLGDPELQRLYRLLADRTKLLSANKEAAA